MGKPKLQPGSFGWLLREARIDAGLKQDELADQVRDILDAQNNPAVMTQSMISRYEVGTTQLPSAAIIFALEDALKLTRGKLWNVAAWTVAGEAFEQGEMGPIFIANPSPTLKNLVRQLSTMRDEDLAEVMRRAHLDGE